MRFSKDKFTKIMLIFFTLVQITLCTLVVGGFTGATIWLEYSAIILCLLFVLVFAINSKNKWIQVSAFTFTLIADAGLVLRLYDNKVVAVAIFCLAQISYFILIMFYQNNKKIKTANIVSVLLLFTLVEIVASAILKTNFDALAFFTSLYLSILVTNVIFSGIGLKQNVYLFIGFLLFLCCDVIVGFASAGGYIDFASVPFIAGILSAPFDIATTFYLISQFFIVLAIIINKKPKNIYNK